MKENTPTTQTPRGVAPQRAIYPPRRESLMSPKKPPPRLSPGSSKTPGRKGKQAATTASSSSSSNLLGAARTPPTVKRIPSNKQPAQSISLASSSSSANLSTQPLLLGQVNPPTPTPSGSGSRRLQLALPSLGTESVPLGSPVAHRPRNSSLSARGLVGSRGEVRIPRSSTFHHIPRPRSFIPPMPPIPEKYKTPPKNTVRVEASEEDPFTDAAAISPETPTPIQEKPSEDHLKREDSSTFITDPDSSVLESTDEELPPLAVSEAKASSALVATPSPFTPNKEAGAYANITASSQIKEFMPANWWAGRFQTRLDQWRADAMRAQLEADFEPEGLVGQYKMDEEKMAMCYIFLQLRDLCVTKEASDSLWEFEYKYRKENRLLGLMITFPGSPSYRKPETAAAKQVQAHFHRAARRVTSRKSSLANLFKGKGKGRAEEGEE